MRTRNGGRSDGEADLGITRRAACSGDEAVLRAPPFRLESIPPDLVVLEHDDRVVGALQVERGRTAIHVPLLVIAEDVRRRGIASGLLRELIDEAIRNGVPLSVEGVPGQGAARLLRGLGFVPVPARSPRWMRFVFAL